MKATCVFIFFFSLQFFFFLHKIKDEFELNIIMSVFQLDNCLSDEKGKKLLKYILRYNS